MEPCILGGTCSKKTDTVTSFGFLGNESLAALTIN